MTEVDCLSSLNITDANKVKERIEPDNGFRRPMHSEQNRLSTFDNWSSSFNVSAEVLARAGFFYTQKDDIVRCAFCGIELGKWNRGDDATIDHARWSQRCPFVVDPMSSGNIPLVEREENSQTEFDDASGSQGYDTCGKYGIQLRPNSYAENSCPPDIKKFAIVPTKPVHPNYFTAEIRVQTFEEWPVSLKQKPRELAEAGFFYTGKGDQTVCFYCGGGLKNWEEEDIPWEQHARWFPKCSFLLLQKSKEYVREVCSKHEAVLTSQQAEAISVPNTPSTSTSVKKEEKPTNSTNVKNIVRDDTTKENSHGSKATLCKICYSKEVGIVFLPCGHMVACVDCAPALSKCAVCRRELEATVRAFLS